MSKIPNCPKCNGEGFEYDVSSKDRILYRCKKCYYRYNSLTGTKLMHSGLSDEQINLLYDLLYKPGPSVPDTNPLPVSQIAEKVQVTPSLVYRYKKLWDSERKASNNQISIPRF
jgi:hypothetical protein